MPFIHHYFGEIPVVELIYGDYKPKIKRYYWVCNW
jgi:hypothetical protein